MFLKICALNMTNIKYLTKHKLPVPEIIIATFLVFISLYNITVLYIMILERFS